MKFVLFTPVHAEAAAGRVSLELTGALLADGHEVVIVGSDLHPPLGSERRFPAPVLRWSDDAVVPALLSADVAVYQVGDSDDHHAGSLEWMPRFPGIVVLHEAFLGNLFRGWCGRHAREPGPIVEHWYGQAVADDYRAAQGRPDFVSSTAGSAPMTEWACSQGVGVLAHDHRSIVRVQNACPGPIEVAAMPWAIGAVSDGDAGDGRLRVLTIVGSTFEHDRVESIVRAIGSSPRLRTCTSYIVAGPVEARALLATSATARKLDVELTLAGPLAEDLVDQLLDECSVVTSLHQSGPQTAPTSLIAAMCHGKPTLVSSTGPFNEVPDDCVVKIADAADEAAIRVALERLLDGPAERTAIGRRAHDRAVAVHGAESYARGLVELSRNALQVAPRLDVVRQAAATLRDWGATAGFGNEFVFDPIFELWDVDARRSRHAATAVKPSGD